MQEEVGFTFGYWGGYRGKRLRRCGVVWEWNGCVVACVHEEVGSCLIVGSREENMLRSCGAVCEWNWCMVACVYEEVGTCMIVGFG